MRPAADTSPVLVTGATGFIGREVVRRLLDAGRPVVVLARGRPDQPAAARVAAAVGLTPDGRWLDVVERLGVRGLSLLDAHRARLAQPSRLERQVARILAGYRDYLEQDVRFDDTVARRLLACCGLPRPSLTPDTVRRLVDQALVTPRSPRPEAAAEPA